MNASASGAAVATDWQNLGSAENCLGYARAINLASNNSARNKHRVHEAPAQLRLNQWALAGDWTWQAEAAVLNEVNGRIAYSFHARDLHLVMGPATRGKPVQFRISIDGKPPGPARGADVDEQGRGTVTEHRMYQLIRQPEPVTDRRFEIEFFDPRVEVFSFTFG